MRLGHKLSLTAAMNITLGEEKERKTKLVTFFFSTFSYIPNNTYPIETKGHNS